MKLLNATHFTSKSSMQPGLSKKSFLSLFVVLFFSFYSSYSIAAVFKTAQAGSFDDPDTWLAGKVPAAGSSVIITDPVILKSFSPVLASITIGALGELSISDSRGILNTDELIINGGSLVNNGGSVVIGNAGGDNKTLSLLDGELTMTRGYIRVNGNVVMSGGSFTLSGGRMNIDPNSGDELSSVEAGVDIFSISAEVNSSVSGGVITFIDPPFEGTGKTFYFFGKGHNVNWGKSTMAFGTASYTNESSAVNGFNVDTRGSGLLGSYLVLGNIVASGGKSLSVDNSNRFVSGATISSHGFDVGGNVTIGPNSELRTLAKGAMLRVRGNISNSGILTDMAGISFSQRTGANYVSQVVTNENSTGIFKNAVSKPTANFSNLDFNNVAEPIGVTFDLGDGRDVEGSMYVSGNVAFTNGIVDIGTDNHLIFTTTATSTRVNGALLRGTGPGGGAQMVKLYPSGASSFTYHIADNIGTYDYSPVTVDFSENNYNGRAVSISVFDTVHPRIKAAGGKVPSDYISRYWRIVGTPFGTSTADITFQYIPEDVVGDNSKIDLYQWNGLTWIKKKSEVSDTTLVIHATEKTFAGTLAEISGLDISETLLKTPEITSLKTGLQKEENHVSLFPNPLSGSHLTVQLFAATQGKYNITVYNQGGVQVYQHFSNFAGGALREAIQLPKNLPAGVYTFLLRGEKGIVSQQSLIIKN